MQVAWLSFFAAFVSLVGAILCAVVMARIDHDHSVYEHGCCTKDVPEGSVESLQISGPVCFNNVGYYPLCGSGKLGDCWAVGTPFHLPFLFLSRPCLGTDLCPVVTPADFSLFVQRTGGGEQMCKATPFKYWKGCNSTKCQSFGEDCWVGPDEEKKCDASYPVPKDIEFSSPRWGPQVKAYTCCPNDATSDTLTASVAVKTGRAKKPPVELYYLGGFGLVSMTPHYVLYGLS
jgi:hypothetical protein